MTTADNRCRLVLVLPDMADAVERARVLGDALKGGDVASVIVPKYDLDDRVFQEHAEKLVPVIQDAGAAALIVNDSRVAGRARADGLHIEGNQEALAEAIEKHTPKMIVGGGTAKERHAALEIGELQPDYIFFGKLDGDIKPEPHSKNLALAEWWASMVEIPCMVMGGTDPESALAVAETGAEFVALGKAVFADPAQASTIISRVNALLDEKAPRFDG
ncbi:thiamine phosphate synthase [Ciceribacter sp. L1K23]|uniref:thiamine phosphate synthase n=1 Tax=Ciceribacter sp. L1K23 TaxID=2820276 RepID=UPI001B83608B|nr:thiamine phosphate synthase [Ciceribacter sp. L1K23]MBR0558215.1 thiamine phosphate synthase [Ciceribacter sp. L1K23]